MASAVANPPTDVPGDMAGVETAHRKVPPAMPVLGGEEEDLLANSAAGQLPVEVEVGVPVRDFGCGPCWRSNPGR